MKKALIWIIVLVLLVAGYFTRQQYGNMAPTGEEVMEDATSTGDMMDIEEVTDAEETVQPTDGGETGVDPVIMEQLEAQGEASVS